MFEGCDGRVGDAWSLQSSNCVLPSFVCCLGCLLDIQLRRSLIIVIKSAEICGGGCFDNNGEVRLQDLLWEKACPDCVSDHSQDAQFGCDASSQTCRCSDVSSSFEPNSRQASAEGRLCHAVLCETREEPFERQLRSSLFLQDCVAVNSQDVVDAADSHTLSDGKFRLWVLAELDAFVHGADDVCLCPRAGPRCTVEIRQ